MSKFLRVMQWLGLTHDEPVKLYVSETTVSHVVHLGDEAEFEITATRHEGGAPIFVIKVGTTDNKAGVDFFLRDREQYNTIIDRLHLSEKVHDGGYSSPPKWVSYQERANLRWVQRMSEMQSKITPPEELWGPVHTGNLELKRDYK